MFCLLDEPDPATGGIGLAFTDRHHGVTPGVMGSLNLGRADADAPEHLRENFTRVGAALKVERFAAVRQVHEASVLTVDERRAASWGPTSHLGLLVPGGAPLPTADALVTCLPGLALTVVVADCLPVLLADPAAGVIGAAHAGRAGLFAGVLPRTVEAMRRLGAAGITAVIGPHVCGACYEVPAAMVDELAPVLPAVRATTSWGTPSLDLAAGARVQLERLGCRVHVVQRCTRTDPALHSHRRDGIRAGRLAGLTWLTDRQHGHPPRVAGSMSSRSAGDTGKVGTEPTGKGN